MFTIFTIVKSFRGEFRQIQYNAIESWLALEPQPEVILCGEREWGAKTAARNLGVPTCQVERNGLSVPFLWSIFEEGNARASHDIRCFVNADIIILQDFVEAIERTAAKFDRFLLSARRHDLGKVEPPFEALKRQCTAETLHKPTGIDVFCYRGLNFAPIPDFAVGRCKYDNWLVAKALSEGVPFVDCTPVATVIHQEHARQRPVDELAVNNRLYKDEFPSKYLHDFRVAVHLLTRQGFERTRYGRTREWPEV